jgi:SAM-dependent methyltransferase
MTQGPPQTAISNQFDLVATSLAQVLGRPHLHLQTPTGMRTYALPPGDETPAELPDVLARGQLYLDLSTKARLDDFANDLQRIEPASHRVRCRAWTESCLGVWNAVELSGFKEEEARLRDVLSALTGVVVDVGAGWPQSLDVLAQAMAEGRVRYLAVDPLLRLDEWRDRVPFAIKLRAAGERLPLQNDCAGAVLMLRSFNHLRDPAQALREAARVLHDRGRLVLVDNTAFGLLRSPRQLACARAVTADVTPFEHLRNATASDAVALLEAMDGSPFAVEQVREVQHGAANQWLVVARRDRLRLCGVEALRAAR